MRCYYLQILPLKGLPPLHEFFPAGGVVFDISLDAAGLFLFHTSTLVLEHLCNGGILQRGPYVSLRKRDPLNGNKPVDDDDIKAEGSSMTAGRVGSRGAGVTIQYVEAPRAFQHCR